MDKAREVLHELPMFKSLPAELKKLVFDSFVQASFAFGGTVVKEGDDAEAFFVIASGRAQVVKQGVNGEEVALNVLRPGDSFGGMALIEKARRGASVRAMSDLEVFKLDGQIFQALISHQPELKANFNLQLKRRSLNDFFRLYTPFAKLPLEALDLLLTELQPVVAVRGELVIRQGDPAGPMYVVEEGKLRAYIEEAGLRNYRSSLRKGDFFGEVSLFKGTGRTASVEAVDDCKLLKLTPETFQKLLKDYPDFQEQIAARIAQYDYKDHSLVPADFADEMLPAEAAAEEVDAQRKAGEVDRRSARAKSLGLFADDEGRFVKKGKRLRSFPHIYQIDVTDSGAACLGMIARHFDLSASLARIRQIVHVGPEGASMRSLCRGAEEVGLAARSVRTTNEHLKDLPLPAIVRYTDKQWTVLFEVESRWVRVADPAQGVGRIAQKEFERRWTGEVIHFDFIKDVPKPAAKPDEGQSRKRKTGFRWMWPFFRPLTGSALKAVALAFMISFFEMLRPVFSQIIIDRVLVGLDRELLKIIVIAMLGVLAFNVVGLLVQRYLLSFIAVRFDAATLDYVTRKLLALPMSYFSTRRAGDIQRRLLGMKQVREFLVQYGVSGLMAVTQLTVTLILMFVYSPTLALVFVSLAPFYGLLMQVSRKRLRPIFNELEEAHGKYQSHQIEAIKGIETVKVLSAEGVLRELMLNQFHGLARRQLERRLFPLRRRRIPEDHRRRHV